MTEPQLDRITQDPDVLDGLPTLRDTGIVVKEVVRQLLNGKTVDAVLVDNPTLETEDVLQALVFTVQSVSALFGGMFFELRHPINNVKGFADWLLAEKALPDEEATRMLENIANNAGFASDTLTYLYNEYRTQHK